MKPPRPNVNRRDLFRLRRVTEAMPSQGAAVGLESQPSALDLLRVHRPGMGSHFEVRLGARLPGALELANRALDLVDELEAQLTIYGDDSEVSRLNATAHLGPVEVEPRLFELLARAVDLSRETGGAYDVTSGALSEVWGFVKGPKRVPEPEELAQVRERSGWRHLRLDRETKTIAFDRPGLRINLGSIGKGYAIDRAVEVIRGYPLPASAMIHAGQSSLFALGSPPGRFGGRWEVALRNPFVPEAPLGVLFLRNRGLGTSGSAFQKFEVNGRVYGHILDPRTGEPALGPASVTVLAPSAALADALSTAIYLLGREWAGEYVKHHPEVGVILVSEVPAEGSPRVETFGITPRDFQAG